MGEIRRRSDKLKRPLKKETVLLDPVGPYEDVGAGVIAGKSATKPRRSKVFWPCLPRRARAGLTETVGTVLQLLEAGTGWGAGVGFTPWYQVEVP